MSQIVWCMTSATNVTGDTSSLSHVASAYNAINAHVLAAAVQTRQPGPLNATPQTSHNPCSQPAVVPSTHSGAENDAACNRTILHASNMCLTATEASHGQNLRGGRDRDSNSNSNRTLGGSAVGAKPKESKSSAGVGAVVKQGQG